MYNLLKMEWYQLLRNRIYWCGMLGTFLLGFFMAGTYVLEVMGLEGGAAASLTDILDGMVYDSTFLLVLISCILSFVLGQEFSWRTVGQEICAGHPRARVFVSKTVAYLLAFHLMALLYPVAGCLREAANFGIGDIKGFLFHFLKAVAASLLLNSAVFLVSILCCFALRNTARAMAVTAALVFSAALYLGYGMMLHLPVGFLPTFQIREVMIAPVFLTLESLAVAFLWCGALMFAGWKVFCRCDLN